MLILCDPPWTAACQASLFFTISQSLLKLMSKDSVMPCHHLIPCCPLSSCRQSLPASGSFLMSQILLIMWLKYWNFSFNISPSSEYSERISFRIDWFDLLVVQGTFKSLVQHHSSKAPILQCSAFFMIQLLHLKTIVLTRRTFVDKVMSVLSRLVIAFLPRSSVF